MEFRILGPLEVVEDGRLIPLDRRLSRALLAYLLLHANEPVSGERLVDQLWGEAAPKTALASLQNYVSRLRKSLGPEKLVLEAGGYVLHVDPERFDLTRFDRLVAEAEDAPAKERAELLHAAIGLWRGEPLEDLALEEFAQAEIAQLSERLLTAIENRIDADLELGSGAELVDELDGLIATHPLRERLRGQLMLALYGAGRQADALDAYREARRILQDELGLEPSEELRSLERRILEQDPALLTAPPARVPIESRRTVTVLFCDVVDSTRLATALDPEAYRRLMSSYYDAARRAIEAHGGAVEKFIGDAVMALFGVPELHEDDTLRAVRAAIDVRDAIESLDAEHAVHVRIAVNTGEVVTSVEGEGPRVTGAAVNVAAHLEKGAAPNEIVLGEKTHELVRDAVRANPVDLGDGLRAYRLDELIGDAQPVTRRFDAPLVGRKRELRRLRTAFQRTRKEQSCVVATVVGEAGIGKTRLAREFVASAKQDARVLVGRCVSYGAGATYLPIAELVRQAAPDASVAGIASLLAGEDDAEQVAQRVAEVIGVAEGPAAPGESFWAIRRLLEVLARERPLVVALDDVHWAEPTLLDLVEYLGEWADGPILVLCLARRELLEQRTGWGGPTSTGFVVELEPLETKDVAALLHELAGGPVAPDIQERIVERAGGHPLFAEQLLALAAEAPDVSLDKAPPTIEALIASRLDRLDPRELDVLRRASIIGRLFSRTELEDLAPVEDADLRSLERRALVHPTEAEHGFRFHHVLVRDVAYRGIPKAERAELHERVANNLDRRDGADEIIGYHLEQAYTYRVELARIDEHARELAAAGGEHLGRAGIRAWKRADAPAAVNLLRRAVGLLEDGEARCELLCELGLALRTRGEIAAAQTYLDQAVRLALERHDTRLELRARIELAGIRLFTEDADVTELLQLASAAIPVLQSSHDDRSLARAWLLVGFTKGQFQCDNTALEEAGSKAAEHYRRAGWSPSTCIGTVGGALYDGPRPVGEAIAKCEQLLEAHRGDRATEANIFVWLGGLKGMRGEFEDGLSLVDRAQAIHEELGHPVAGDTCGNVRAGIEILANRIELAEQALRHCCEACIRASEWALLASRAAELADVLYRQSQYDDAGKWTELSRERARPEDLDAQSSWRSVAAKLKARSGMFAEAENLAREAVEIAESTDALNHRGKMFIDLAEVLRCSSRDEAAADAVRKAIALHERKGNVVAADQSRLLLRAAAPA